MSPTPTLPETFALIVRNLLHTVASHLNARHSRLGPALVLLHRQIARKVRLLAALHQAFRDGTLRPPRRRAPRPQHPQPPDAEPQRPKPPPRPRLPSGPWIVRLVPEAAGYRSQLEHLLRTEPDLPAFLAAAPQAGRLLRPVCRMLGIEPPPSLRLPPRPKPPPKPKAPPDPDNPRPPTRAALLRQLFPGYRLSLKACR